MLQYKFDTGNSSFFKELRNKVDDYFTSTAKNPYGERKLYFKGILQVVSAIGLYITLVFFTPPVAISILLCVLLGLNLAVIGFNVMHEGGHQTFSRRPWLNRIAAYFLNILGGNIYFWKKKHNINHHTYTNIEGMDSDIDVKPFMRLHEGQPLHWYHRFQHIYWSLLYGLSYLSWIFYEDFKKYFSGKPTITSGKKKLPAKEHAIFWLTKLMYIGMYMVLPVFMIGWLPWLIGFLIITFVTGLAISVVFQLAHVVELTDFHSPQVEHGQQEWAIHQLLSTANFATSNRLLYWLLGGLNFQIEHHLFPRVSHIHYRKISQLVRETCEEYNVVYHEYESMLQAIGSHLMLLKKLGNPKLAG
jgi:linoleoyl-CoA desaturase